MSGVSSVTTTNNQYPVQTDNTQGTGQTKTTGSGSTGKTGEVPPVTQLTYNLIMGSIAALMPNMSSEDVSVLIAEVATKLKDAQQMSENEKYKNDAEEKRSRLAEKRDKLEESNEKLKKAEEEKKSGNIFTAIKLFFQMLGAALSIALGVLLQAVPGLNVLGGLMIAAGVLMAIQALDGIVKAANGGHGIMGSIIMAAGGDEKAAMIGDMAFGITVAVASVAVGIATIAVGNVKAIADLVKESMTLAQQVGQIISQGANLASAAVDVANTGISYSAAQNTADAKKAQAGAKEIEAIMAMLDDAIDQALARMMAAGDRFNDILDAVVEAMNDRGHSLAKARFGA